MTRDLDRALFLAGEATLDASEVAEWASELGYPLMADATEVAPGEPLRVAIAGESEGWRDG